MRFCGKKQLHFVSDEVYALSEFRDEAGHRFVSAIAIDIQQDKSCEDLDGSETGDKEDSFAAGEAERILPKPTLLAEQVGTARTKDALAIPETFIDLDRVHLVWCTSKDFGSSGLRMV